MAKRLTTEVALALLPTLRDIESDDDLITQLRLLLRHRSNFVIAKAAALAEERTLTELSVQLAESFTYFMSEPVKRDPGCSAKLAIVNALSRFHEPAHDVFLAGIQHRQLEPSFGPPIDTAATLRALCGRALIAFGHGDAFRWHALLLADPEPMTRTLAVETLAEVPDERAELLLRCKIAREPDLHPRGPSNTRDPEPAVEAEAFDALMKIAPDDSFDFVKRYLDDREPDRVRAAALAIGTSRHADAFATLRDRWFLADDENRMSLALPIALVRSNESFDLLLDKLETGDTSLAESIVEALAIFREDTDRATTIRDKVQRRDSTRLYRVFVHYFESGEGTH